MDFAFFTFPFDIGYIRALWIWPGNSRTCGLDRGFTRTFIAGDATYVVWQLVEYREEKRENDITKQRATKRKKKERGKKCNEKEKEGKAERGGGIRNPDSVDMTPINNICEVTFMTSAI
jgi:hypothetical protein